MENLNLTDDEIIALNQEFSDEVGPTLQSFRERLRRTAEKIVSERALDKRSKV